MGGVTQASLQKTAQLSFPLKQRETQLTTASLGDQQSLVYLGCFSDDQLIAQGLLMITTTARLFIINNPFPILENPSLLAIHISGLEITMCSK